MKEKILTKLSTVTFEPWESEAVSSSSNNSISSSESKAALSSTSPGVSGGRSLLPL